MHGTVIAADFVVLADRVLNGAAVRTEGERITGVGPLHLLRQEGDGLIAAPPGAMLTPGLIDIHIHGGQGLHFHKAGPAELDALMRILASWGVTGALPTLGAMLRDELPGAVERLRDLAGRQTGGARVLGIHLEGPYFNPQKKGAQYADAIRLPDRAETERLLALADGLVRLMTLAPEMAGGEAVLAALRRGGVVASVGHSEATWEELIRLVPQGVRHATHTGNAMTGVHHRTPGTLGAVLALDEVTCELIGDSFHIHPAIMKLIWRAKGTERTVLVSDATAAAGLPDGTYPQGHRTIIIKNGMATLPDGTLAGSCSPLHRSVRNMVRLVGAPLHEAVRMASLNPARVIRCADRTGSIEPGKTADLTLFDPEFQPLLTMVQGEVVYARSGE